MNIQKGDKATVFKNENTYTVGLSKKDKDGKYENGYMLCQFKKDVAVESKTKIVINDAWLTFYKDKNNYTVPYIFINDFTAEEGQAPVTDDRTSILERRKTYARQYKFIDKTN